jgi:hypothetical protein
MKALLINKRKTEEIHHETTSENYDCEEENACLPLYVT